MAIHTVKSKLRIERIKEWYSRYERYLIPGSLLIGVVIDAITFRNINTQFAFTILAAHLFISISTITFVQFYDAGLIKLRSTLVDYIRLFSPMIVQFTFGALLSGFFIFYGFTGAISASWPFILLIVFLMISNDVLKKYYLRFTVQVGVYYFVLFSFLVLVVPYIFNTISVWMFILSGVMSVALISLYVLFLHKYIYRIRKSLRLVTVVITSVFVVMNTLYFTNIIPPIPLSMRDSGVYQYIERTNEGYVVQAQEQTLIDRIRLHSPFYFDSGEYVYFYSAVFVPTDLSTEIVHHWQYFDPDINRWLSISRIQFPISGGREEGFRGYSRVSNITSGLWRVDTETLRGQVIGRDRFRLSPKTDHVPTYTEVK